MGNKQLEDMFKVLGSEGDNEIIRSFFSDDNIEMKTEYPNPMAMVQLIVLRTRLSQFEIGGKHLDKTVAVLDIIIKQYPRLMVSDCRKSREEGERMVSAIREVKGRKNTMGWLGSCGKDEVD